jgi:signal transduction histidine kinase
MEESEPTKAPTGPLGVAERGDAMTAPGPSAAPTAGWRETVLQEMMTIAAVVAPMVLVLAILVRAVALSWIDILVTAVAAILPPALRFGSRASVAVRAGAVIAVVFATSLYFLARIGFAAGVPVALAATCVLGGIYLGRTFGLTLVAFATLAVAGIGLLVTSGSLHLIAEEVDPFRFLNWVRMAMTTSLLAGLVVAVIDLVIQKVEAGARTATQTLAELRLAFAELGQLHGRLEVAKEEERSFIAHELHDELGQLLTALKLRLQLDARAAGGSGADGSPGLTDALAIIDDLLGRVRRMSGDLRPPLLDEVGLASALRGYLEGQAAASGVEIALDTGRTSHRDRLPADLEIACFRIVQESVTNALRHANPGRIWVRVDLGADGLSLSVADDGRGFDRATLDQAAAAGHVGVVGMRERVSGRGGSFELDTRPGGGCTVDVRLPLVAGDTAAAPAAAAIAERATRWAAIESWRDSARLGTLTIAAVVTPLLAALAAFVGTPRRSAMDLVVFTAVGVLLPVLRFVPRRSIVARATAGILVLFVASTYVLARAGFGTGISVMLLACAVIAIVCLGRRFGLALIGLTAASYLVVGQLVTHGVLIHDPAEADPLLLQNWLRLAATLELVGTLLVAAVAFVIRHLEASAAAATEAAAELAGAYRRLGQLHGRLDAAKEEERRSIAHELHDELGQTLTALKLRLQLGARLEVPLRAALANGEALAIIDQLIARVRKMSGDLRPTLLDEVGLVPALRAYLDIQASLSGVAITLAAHEEPEGTRLPPPLEIACFRIVQESLTNALRHAAPMRIEVRLAADAGRVSLSIRDDGRGFDAGPTLEAAAVGGHLGVVGMRERVRGHGGTFSLASRLGGGTTIWVTLPVEVSEPPGRTAASGSP